jgi:hypothetical protein
MRHTDFQRIYDEFCKYYKRPDLADKEYYTWLNGYGCDESKPYGRSLESFQWAKDMLRLLKEDADNKYYGCLVGLPLTSMNGNVYRERDLIAAALTLKGKSPSVNHKDAYWLKNEGVVVEDAKYEDGAVEAVLRVPKSAKCPVDRSYMTELLDNGKILNVSLEGTNEGVFEFTDPPFTLLTSDILPGIPLARIKPLEQIVSEAFHSTNSTGKKNTLKITPKIREERGVDNPQTTTVNTGSRTDPNFKGQTDTPITADSLIDSQNDLAKTTVGGSVADNYKMSYGTPMQPKMKGYEAADAPAEQCPVGTHWDPAAGRCVADTEAPPAQELLEPQKPDERTGPTRKPAGTYNAPDVAQPPKVHSTTVKGESPCQQDGVWTGSSPVGESLPSLEERRGRIHAELLAKSNEEKAIAWEQKHNEAYEKLAAKTAQYNELSNNYEQLRLDVVNERNMANQKLENTIVRMEKAVNDYNMVAGDKLKIEQKFQELTASYNEVNKKYNEALSTNLTLSQKVTRANEDYLEVAKKLESTSEALERTRIEAKKILKVKI